MSQTAPFIEDGMDAVVDGQDGSTAADLCAQFSVSIFGAGAIGCHLAFVLHRSGCDVSLIARGENLLALRRDGLQMEICGEQMAPLIEGLRFRVTDKPDEIGHTDYVFITVKVGSYGVETIKSVWPLIGPRTVVLPPTTSIPYWWFHMIGDEAVRGRRLERVDPQGCLWRAFPPERVLGFTMWLSAVQAGPGKVVVRHVQRGYPIGELNGEHSARAERLAQALERGGIPSSLVHDIRAEIFMKAVNSLAFNVVAVLGDASNCQIADVPEAVETLYTIMVECEQLAQTTGIEMAQSPDSRIQQTLSARAHTMSMLHDLRMGKQLELRRMWVSFQDLAEVLGCELPITRALVNMALLRESTRAR